MFTKKMIVAEYTLCAKFKYLLLELRDLIPKTKENLKSKLNELNAPSSDETSILFET